MRCEFASKADRFLANFDQWAMQPALAADTTFRIYQFITNVLYKCGPMLYSRAKANCFLNTAFQNFILTPAVLMGKQIPSSTSQGVLKSFPFLLELLASMNYRQDAELADKMNGLVLKWTPHLVKMNQAAVFAAYAKVFAKVNADAVEYILGQMVNQWLVPNGRMAGVNAVWMAQLLKKIVVESKDEIKLQKIVASSINVALDHSVVVDEFASSKKALLDVFEELEKLQSVQ